MGRAQVRSEGRNKGLVLLGATLCAFILAIVCVAALPSQRKPRNFDPPNPALELFAQGKFAEAAEALEVWLKDHPSDLEARSKLGRCRLAVGNVAAALAEFLKVLEKDDRHYDATIGAAASYAGLQMEHLALVYYELAASIRPEDATPLKAIGRIYLAKRDPTMALSYLQRAQALDPQDEKIAELIGEVARGSTREKDLETYGGLGLNPAAAKKHEAWRDIAPRIPNPVEEAKPRIVKVGRGQ